MNGSTTTLGKMLKKMGEMCEVVHTWKKPGAIPAAHNSGAMIGIDVGVIDFLAAAMDAVDAQSATILSAYRTSKTNAMLQRTTFGIAENSQHLYGLALDIRLETRLAEAMGATRGNAAASAGTRIPSSSISTRDRYATGT